jgi:hypothetical protein
MKATIEFNTQFGIAEREIDFNKNSDPQKEFEEIITKIPTFIKKCWASIDTENWKIQSSHFKECNSNFWMAMEIK